MERSAEVEGWVRRLYELMRAADASTLVEFVPDEAGVTFVGTDAEEWWDSTEAIRSAFREQLEAAGGFQIHEEDLHGFRVESVGWFSDRPTMRFPDGGVVPMRLTGVVRELDGEWQMVQGHLSVAANINEQLFE